MLDTASVSLTGRCNLSCSHCGADAATGRASRRELTAKELQKLFRDLRDHGTTMLFLAGGEPLLRKDLPRILHDIGEFGMACGLLTNGLLLTHGLMKKCAASGALHHIRFSVEFPADVLTNGRYHDTSQVIRKIATVRESGIPAGVNMVLMPENIRYADRLAGSMKKAGASFFRAVPLLPVGRSKSISLPAGFFSDCIATLLFLRWRYGDGGGNAAPALTRRKAANRGSLFAEPCNGGVRSIAIDADGRAHLCPIVDAGERPVYITDTTVEDCLRVLVRRRSFLRRKITAVSRDGSCGSCRFRDTCGGGCFAEWLSRGAEGGQPCCYYHAWKKAVAGIPYDSKMEKVVSALISEYEDRPVFSQGSACLRAMPFWTVYFD